MTTVAYCSVFIINLNTHLKILYTANYSRWKNFMAFGRLIDNDVKNFQHNNTASNNSPV